uniref:Uncharacterized protein n=1 Tax=Glossina palpalis gambiensis TaxID=67801 RepID=A0A1B0AP24_9MUSC
MTGQLQEYANRRIAASDEDFLSFDNADNNFAPIIVEAAAGLGRIKEREVHGTEEEIEVENVEENGRIMDTTGETERDDSTIRTTPSSPYLF